MESMVFWFVVLFAGITIYRLLARRAATPKARVALLLRRYRSLAARGLTEEESLFRMMVSRAGWKRLPNEFLRELVRRLSSKEEVIRFVSLCEDYRYVTERFPAIAGKTDLGEAMADVACILSRFGYELQKEGRLKEAEFVQRLALPLGPDHYFTNLPLAATYYETGRYRDAAPLFERGLAELEKIARDGAAAGRFSLSACLDANTDAATLRAAYLGKYEECLKASGGKGR